jgi:hypothetical protein
MSAFETIVGHFRLGAGARFPVHRIFTERDDRGMRRLRILFETPLGCTFVRAYMPPGRNRLARAAQECGRGAALYAANQRRM